jgi:monomeric sarcosine oxidase
MSHYETIVLGLGAMGSAVICHLARRGNRVLGIDRFSPPHARGSTHGDSRITRLAIGEGDQYTPLALRSHQLWRELEKETGTTLLTICGGLVISSSAKTSHVHAENFFGNTLAAAKKYAIAHEILDATAIRRRFPGFNVADNEQGYFERDAGFVRPEACVRAQLSVAERRGAEIRRGEQVLGFEASDRAATVMTDSGTYSADRLVVTLGPWLPELVDQSLARHFAIYRQTMFWFDVDGPAGAYLPGHWPVFIWELQGRTQGLYGFPAIDGSQGGMKIASEQFAVATTADAAEQNVNDDEKQAMYDDYVKPYIAGASSRCLRAATCLYTVTRDFGFVIDSCPGEERVLIVSACSGHGFKHSPAIGEAVADLLMHGSTALDLGAFSLKRLLSTDPATKACE